MKRGGGGGGTGWPRVRPGRAEPRRGQAACIPHTRLVCPLAQLAHPHPASWVTLARMNRYLLSGQYQHYSGEAVNPRFLSLYERWQGCAVHGGSERLWVGK